MATHSRSSWRLLLPAVVALLAAAPTLADTLYVPSQYATIQAAIDAADPNDVVEIADGTYTGVGNKDLDLGGKALTVRSASGDPSTCIIDCEEDGRGFYFHNNEGPNAVVEALTITNGDPRNGSESYDGGGVCIDDSSPTLTNCVISNNYSVVYGGGIFCSGSSSNPTLTNCTISDNASDYEGGGVFCDRDSAPTLTNCILSGNSAGSGGGIFCYYNCNPTVMSCTISGNSAGAGGGIYCWRADDAAFTNCVINGNTADYYGSGISCASCDPTLTNCTISGNVARSTPGGGFYCDYSSPTVTNCIVWGNTPEQVYVATTPNPVLTYCNVQGGWEGIGNIDADPQFALATDSHLMSGSPCIDVGSNYPPGGLPPDDLDGTPRPLDGDGNMSAIADMGAYEFDSAAPPRIALGPTAFEFFAAEGGTNPPGQTLLVRNCGSSVLNWEVTGRPAWLTATPGSGDSSGELDEILLSVDSNGLLHDTYSEVLQVVDPLAINSPRDVLITLHVNRTLTVPSEYATIQAAIDAAIPGDTVEIADGTYAGAGNKDLDFGGKPLTVRSASGDPSTCIIDCEGEGRGFYFHSGEGPSSVVRGLTVTNGDVRGEYLEDENINGGGIRIADSSPTITDCTITGNVAYSGAGVICENSDTTLTNCTISSNVAESYGGGVYSSSGSPILNQCAIDGNHAQNIGGGVYTRSSSLTLTNCTISRNSTNSSGGGVYCSSSGNVLTLTNCTISGNQTYRVGGGIRCSGDELTLTNCIARGNTPEQIFVATSTDSVLTYCNIEGGWDGEGNIDVDPQFAFDTDFHLMPGSPCIDAGTNDPPGGLPADDRDGTSRPLDGDGDMSAVADMGAYEFDSTSPPRIAVSPPAIEFFASEGGANPPSQTLSVRNCGPVGVMNWQVTGQPAWLTATPSSGQSSGEVDEIVLSVDSNGLPHGAHNAVLQVVDPVAINSPQEVLVTLYVNSALSVPSVYATIQAAIDAAVAGDVVAIADGTYTGAGNKNLDFGGKPITVCGASGDPSTCIIDCEEDGRGFYFHNNEGPRSVVRALTVANGDPGQNDPVSSYGGGVYIYGGGPTLLDCIISGSLASNGGGIYAEFASPTLIGCTISENAGGGGGIWCYSCLVTLVNCTISGNRGGSGGGVYGSYYNHLALVNCTISGNVSGQDGGGVNCYGDNSLTLIGCTINGNVAGRDGGGVSCSRDDSVLTLIGCTFAANLADDDSGAVYWRGSGTILANCIIWDNVPTASYILGAISYSDIEGSAGAVGVNCIDVDPLFADADGPDDDPNIWEDNDYRLSAGSPCIDAGNNLTVPADAFDLDDDGDVAERTPWDLDLLPRFFDDPDTTDSGVADLPDYPDVVDMGAYEFRGSTCVGDLDGDEDVDLADLQILLSNYGESGVSAADGDMDDDGDIDLADLQILLSQYGSDCG